MFPGPLKIGNAQGFWGDSVDAPSRLIAQQPDLDYLTLDYLAEVSLSILALQKERDPSLGYARDFLEVVRSLVPFWKNGCKTRLVTNAGGLNPEECALACLKILQEAGCHHIKVATVLGDDVLPAIEQTITDEEIDPQFNNLETQQSIGSIADQLITANAYLGARPIAEALTHDAQIVVTGRVADPSLTVGPCAAHFGWSWENYDQLAGATVAGHLIECGTQVTGGFSTHWLSLPDLVNIGFPIAEVMQDGSCVITKPAGTGGQVSLRTVKEQLLYEIGDPGKYLSPDVTVSFLSLALKEVGTNRVQITNAKGSAPTDSYKVSATFENGYKAHGMLTIFGNDAVKKAQLCGQIVLERLQNAGFTFQRSLIECLGTGASVGGILRDAASEQVMETVLRISVADPRREAVERFAKELAPLITSGPQGVTGYASGRPKVQTIFGYWPCLIEKSQVTMEVKLLETND
jgi:hypothetical protein